MSARSDSIPDPSRPECEESAPRRGVALLPFTEAYNPHMKPLAGCLIGLLGLLVGCDHGERISRLEKSIQDIQTESKRTAAAVDFDLQSKCARDSKTWFSGNWSPDKDTIILNYTNHYNKAMNKCFIVVEYHYNVGKHLSWASDISLWDIYENTKVGAFGEMHMDYGMEAGVKDRVSHCNVGQRTCKSLDEFNGLAISYMQN